MSDGRDNDKTNPGSASPELVPSYPVGYARPPPSTRFQKGSSGNPAGRPKGTKGVRTIVNAALDETIRVAENGRPRDMRKRQAILLAMITKAIKGDVRAASLVVRLMEAHDPLPHQPDDQMTHDDWILYFSDEKLTTRPDERAKGFPRTPSLLIESPADPQRRRRSS